MAFRIVIPAHKGHHEGAAKILEQKGCEIRRLPVETGGWTPALIDEYARDAHAFMGAFNGMQITRPVLEAAENLRVVTSPIIGVDTIDVEAATELGLVVAHGSTPENYLGVAEAVVMMIAALRKRLLDKSAEVHGGRWRVADVGNMVRDCTVGFIGFGKIGRATAKRLVGWECTVIACDPYVDDAVFKEHGVERVDRDTLVKRSDVVSLMVVLTEETKYILGKRELAMMPKGSYVINAARGGCVDEAALLDALDSGHIAGAAIDTWEEEPSPADHRLRNHPQVIPTAHNIAHSHESYASLPPVAAESTWRGLHGEDPVYIRNPEVLPRWRERIARLHNR